MMKKQMTGPRTGVYDARRLKPAEQHAKRNKVVELHGRGLSRQQIAAETGMSKTTVARITKLYKSGGEEALQPQSRGRRTKSERPIELAHTIQDFICGACWGPPKLKP